MRASRRLPLEALEPYLLDVPHPGFVPPDSPLLAPQPPVDWHAIFGNDHAVEIEIGFGKGLFLLTQGQARPDTNFLGIEIERKYTLLTATHLVQRGLPNVKLACTDARWFLRERVTPGSVAAVHIYFPDPWWKKRHPQSRKLFTSCVCRAMRDRLAARWASAFRHRRGRLFRGIADDADRGRGVAAVADACG